MNFCCNNARNACFSGDHVRSTPRCGPRRSVIGTAGVDPEPTFPGHHPPPCQGLCQTVVPSTEYDPQSHKNGKSAQKPDNSRHLFKYIHRKFPCVCFRLWSAMYGDAAVNCLHRSVHFFCQSNPRQPHSGGWADQPCGGDNSVEENWWENPRDTRGPGLTPARAAFDTRKRPPLQRLITGIE